MNILFLIPAILASASSSRDVGDNPGPRRRMCDQAAFHSCLEGNQQQANLAKVSVAVLSEKISLLEQNLAPVTAQSDSFVEELRSLEISRVFSTREIEEDSAPEQKDAPIFVGGPTPREVFLLGKGEKLWSEAHRSERILRLKDFVNHSGILKENLRVTLQKLAMQINALKEELAQTQGQKREAELRVFLHDRECKSGCRERHCPEN